MSNYIKVSVPKMENKREELYSDIDKIPQFVRELDDSMRSLGMCWEGPAWITFQQQVESDIVNILEVYDWLRNFLQVLTDGEKSYGSCEEKCYDCIDKIRI